MAKIYKYRGLSTRKYKIESLEEEVGLERPGGHLSPSFKAQVSLLEPQEEEEGGRSVTRKKDPAVHSSSQEEEESDQHPLDLSSSRSNRVFQNSREEDAGGEGSDSNSSRSNESPLSERSFSPEAENIPRRGPRLTRDEKWMIDQGVTEFISINDVIGKEHPELKRQVEGLVLLGRLTESQAQELLHIRKRGRNKITAKKSRKKKDAEIDHLKKAVREAEKKQKPVADEQRELLLELAFWEEKFAQMTHFLLIAHKLHPDDYQVVVEGEDVKFVGRGVG